MADVTLKITLPHMTGDVVEQFQRDCNTRLKAWGVNYQLEVDGDYGQATRDVGKSLLYGLGVDEGNDFDGISPADRLKIRHGFERLSDEEKVRWKDRKDWRERFAAKYSSDDLHTPITNIISSAWGWHPGVHDGVDLICDPNAPLLAICDGEIVRADAGGWWGKGAPLDPVLKARGDGIIVLRSTTDHGIFRPGLNFCYGHAESPVVRKGDRVKAGDRIGTAGFANAWHAHFMVNDRSDALGLGDRDPMPYVRFAQEQA
jgi:murein DD-endopeptidase MepM/ murein hydrolase activator NlpD